MSQESVEVVQRAYDVAYAQRSVEDVREHIADDFVFHNRPEFPGRSSYTGEQMPLLWADLDETYSDFNLLPVEFTEIGDYVVVTLRISSRLRGSDTRIENSIWHVWHIEAGEARQAWAYGSRQEALEAVGLRK